MWCTTTGHLVVCCSPCGVISNAACPPIHKTILNVLMSKYQSAFLWFEVVGLCTWWDHNNTSEIPMQSILVQVTAFLRLLKIVKWDVGDVKQFLLLNFMWNYNLHSTSLKRKKDKDKGQPICSIGFHQFHWWGVNVVAIRMKLQFVHYSDIMTLITAWHPIMCKE